MPVFFDEAITRSLYKRAQGYRHLADGTVVDENGLPTTRPPALTYQRGFWITQESLTNTFGTRKDWLTGYGLDNNAEILVIGCGFGFLIEYLIDAGIPDVWGIEPGDWFWDPSNDTEWRIDVKPRVANDWIGSGTEKSSLEAIGAGNNQERFTWVVDEDAVTMHTDAELPAFIAACEDRLQGNARGRIVHMVTPLRPEFGPGDTSVNWKTLADWKAVEPAHNWVDIKTGEVA